MRLLAERINLNPGGIVKAQGQLVAMNPQFHGISHGCQLYGGHFSTGNDAHIQKMLPQSTLAAHIGDDGGFSDG